MAVLYCVKDLVLHMEVSWCAVHVYSATTCAPEDLDDSLIWGAKRCFELLGGNTQHFLQVMEMFLCWGSEAFAIVSETEKSDEGLDRIVPMPNCWPFLSGLLQVCGISQSHILLFVSHESSFLLTCYTEEQGARRMTLINQGRWAELVVTVFVCSQWNWLDSQQQSYGSSFVPGGSHLLLPFAIFKVFIAVYCPGTG